MIRKALTLCGLIVALGAGCSKSKSDTGNKVEKSSNATVEYEQYKDGYRKTIKRTPYGEVLRGEYMIMPGKYDSKVRIYVHGNKVLGYVRDREDDGKADSIHLEGYLDNVRTDREANPLEFQLADNILKYWKETN